MKFHEETLSKNYVYRGKILNLRCDDARRPDGKPCKREIVEHSGGAAVLAETERGIALVKQFRYAYGEEIYEIPAGKLNAGEDPMEAARRELKEETGLEAEKLTFLTVLYPSPGYTDEKIYIYRAETAVCGESKLDDGEFLDVEYFERERVVEMITRGQIRDSKTIAAILFPE